MKEEESKPKKPAGEDAFTQTQVSQKLRSDYASSGKEPAVKALEGIQQLVDYLSKEDLRLQEALDFVTRMIYKYLSIKEVTVGLKSSQDGLYRYRAMYGLTAKSWEAHKPIVYTSAELFDGTKYKGTSLSRRSILYLVEDRPYDDDELRTFAWYLSGQQKRHSLNDSIEGDYIDVIMFDRKNEVLGWIEVGATWDGRLPDGRIIRALEAIASILSLELPRLMKEDKP